MLSRWEGELNTPIDMTEWLKALNKSRMHSDSTRMKSWNYKFYLRDVPYNARLHKMGISQTEQCERCPGNYKESISHLYWFCPASVDVWKGVFNWMKELYDCNTEPGIMKCLFNLTCRRNDDWPLVFDVLTMHVRYYIHRSKCKGHVTNLQGLERYLRGIIRLERAISSKNNTQAKFQEKWDRLSL